MTKWYVTVNENSDYADEPDVRVWTVSRDPDDTGWETDGGFPGYGLTKHDAEELANAANRIKMIEWQLIETAPKDGTDVLVFQDPMMVGAYWDTDPKDEGGQVWRIKGMCEYLYPTHWMNLPEPPKQEAE